MRASHYHTDHEEGIDKISETSFIHLPWPSEEAYIECLVGLEKDAMRCFRDDELDAMLDGKMTVSDVVNCFSDMVKESALSTPQERERMRAYREKNKGELARKAKIRRDKIKSGIHRKKKRIGSAGGGYSFVSGSSFGGGSGGGGSTPSRLSSVPEGDFNPNKNTSSTRRQRLISKGY